MVTAQARRFQPAQLIQGTVRIRNSGTRPAIFAVRVTPGTSGILGFSPEASSRTVLTPRAVGPGDTVAVPVSIRLPEQGGPKAFRVEVGEADPSGMLLGVIDTQVFANLVDIAMEMPITPTGLPTAPTPQQLASQFADGLGRPTLSVSPNEVTVGQSVRVTIQIPSSAPFAFTPEVRLLILDANNTRVRRESIQPQRVAAGLPVLRQVDINTTGLAPGSYGLRVGLVDPITSMLLGDPVTFSNVFRVLAAAAPAAPAPVAQPEPIVIPTTGGVPLVGITPAPIVGPATPRLLTVTAPTLTPTTVAPGGAVTGTWTLRNPRAQPIRAFLFLDGPIQGQDFGATRTIDPGEVLTLQVFARIATGQPDGPVTYGLAVRDGDTRTTISPDLVERFTLTVAAPTAAPAPAEVGIQPGDLTMAQPFGEPIIVSRTQQTNIGFSLSNRGGVSGNVSVIAFPRDSNNRIRGSLRATVPVRAFGSTPFELSYTVPEDSLGGSWSVQVIVWDPRTGTALNPLINQTFQGVFRVR